MTACPVPSRGTEMKEKAIKNGILFLIFLHHPVLEHTFSVLERPFPVLEHPFPVLEHPFPVLERPFLF